MAEQIILFSNNCPKCKILKNKLDEKKVNYIISDDFDLLIAKGFMSAPILQVGEEFKEFAVANKWVNEVVI